VDFSNLVQKEKRRLSFKWVQLALAAVVLLAVALFSVFKSDKAEIYAHDFIPPTASFYYEWSDQTAIKQNSDKYWGFDKEIPQEHLTKIAGIMGEGYQNVEELVWFRLEEQENDFYLLRFSDLSDKYLASLVQKNSGLFFYQPSDNILFISPNSDLGVSLSPQIIARWNLNYSREGVNIYWQLDKPPVFLQSLSTMILPLASVPETFVNFSEDSFDLYQPKSPSSTLEYYQKFKNSKIPQKFDSAIGFNASSTDNFSKIIIENIVLPNFASLPYQNLSFSELNAYMLKDSLLFSVGSDWLLVSDTDWRSRAGELAQNLQLVEVKKTLSDGTLYTELLAADEQALKYYDFAGQKYWQVDNLYGWGLERAYYLSNSAKIIEDLIVSDNIFPNLQQNCLSDSKNIGDFLLWPTNKLPAGQLRAYLEEQNIASLKLFSYQNYLVEGIKFCF